MPWARSCRRERPRVGPVQLAVAAVRRLESEPDPRDAQLDEFPQLVFRHGVGRREDVERPGLAVRLHQLEQFHRPLAVEQEVLVHHEEGGQAEFLLRLAHHLEQVGAVVEEADRLALAAEEGRRGAEVAPDRAADRRDDRRRPSRSMGHGKSHDAEAERRGDRRVDDRLRGILAEVGAHPGDALALDQMIGIDEALDPGNGRDVTADDDLRVWRVLANEAAHLADLPDVDDDPRDADDVVALVRQFADEARPAGKVEQRRGSGDVVLDELDAPRTVEHPQREGSLLARDLVLVELHRVDGPAAELVVLRVRAEDRGEQDACVNALGMLCLCHRSSLSTEWSPDPIPGRFG